MDEPKKVSASVNVRRKNKQTDNLSKSVEEVTSSKDGAVAACSKEATDITPSRVRIVQNFRLVWLDGSIDKITDEDSLNTIIELRRIVNTINAFIDIDECVDFIRNITEEKIFLISSGLLGQTTVPVVHEMTQVRAIYIYCENKAHHEQWVTQWPKVKGVFTEITPLYAALKQAVREFDKNSISMSFVTSSNEKSTDNLDQLDQSFMYTQILKEVLLTLDFEQKHFVEFITYCREQFIGNTIELRHVDKVNRKYRAQVSIWWYTYRCFLYSMLNRALRTMEVDLVIKMGFFIQDLHNQITQLHSEQYVGKDHAASFTVFRDQGLSQTDFDQLKKTQGGLLSFNNFISTSKNRGMSLRSARQTIDTSSDLMGVLFVMTIDPSIPSTPFANICDVSYSKGEDEILFSMNSIFRIGQIKQMDSNLRLWQVDLTLTGETDPYLRSLTQRMLEDTTGWDRLGYLMVKLGHFNKAEELYKLLLDQTTDQDEKAHLYHMLGTIKTEQGEYTEAVAFYETTIQFYLKTRLLNDPNLAGSYCGIGSVYDKMGEYSKALPYHEKALKIYRKTLPKNHPYLACPYGHIGMISSKLGEHSKAVLYCERALKIVEHSLPADHPDLQVYKNNLQTVKENCK